MSYAKLPRNKSLVKHKTKFHHMSNSRECMAVNGEALKLLIVYKKSYFLPQVTQNPYQVLQVMRAASECAMKKELA